MLYNSFYLVDTISFGCYFSLVALTSFIKILRGLLSLSQRIQLKKDSLKRLSNSLI